MMHEATFGRRIGNTFPVTLYVRSFTMGGNLSDHIVAVILINETKGKRENVPCTVEGNEVKFSFTSALQYRLGGTGIYTPVLAVDAGDENLGEADWYKSIEIVAHSVQEYSSGNSGVNIGGVVLQADLTLVSNGLSAYEMWKADGYRGTLHDYIEFNRQPAVEAAARADAAEAIRAAAESVRQEEESTRQSNEQNRQSQESARQNAAAQQAEQAGRDHQTATSDHTQAGNDHTRAEGDHSTAESDHTRAGSDHTRAEGDHNTAGQDHTQAGSDHTRAEGDHNTAGQDHTQAGTDHTRAESDHGTAESDQTRAGSDHTRAEGDHDTAGQDHTQAGTDHTRANSDHDTAGSDHTQAGDDHTRANSDHSTAESDHIQAGNDHTRADADHEAAQEAIHASSTAVEAAREATAAAAALQGAVEDIATLKDDVEELLLGSHDHMAAAWADGQTSPTAAKTAGDSSLVNYHMFVIDHTRNQETVSHPLGKLKMNNYLRYDDGSFAPTVGITQAMYEECMTHDLYMNGELYCASGAFDPVAFFELCTVVTGQDNVKRISCPMLLKDAADGTEVSHYLMPWETTGVNLSLMLGCEHPLYMLQNVKGTSGRVWNFLSTVRKSWDGHESVELKPTAFSPCPVGMVVDGNSKRHLRTMFCIYDGPSAGNCAGSAGDSNNITMFKQKGRMMPAANVISQVTNMQYARNDNVNNEGPTPFAEGGYHALNTFIAYLEIKYGTRNLHASSRFGSGISSNDSCTNEETWRANGGVRCRKVGADTWTYQTLGGKPSIIRKNATGTQWSDWSSAINNYYPKEAVMESQMAASFAVEMGIDAGENFEFYGNVYTWGNAGTADGLGEGRMNSVIRSIRKQNVEAYDAEGNAATFEVEVCLRMSLFEGANLSGDVYMYWGGGMDIIGVCGANTANGTFGHRIDAWFEPDQGKWLDDTDVSHNDGSDFDCESEYTHLGGVVTTANGYSLKDLEMAPFATQIGGSISQGMCHYNYLQKNWSSTQGAKARVGVRFRGLAHFSYCSPRALLANTSAGYTYQYFCGSAQVALPESATTTQS